LIAPERIQSESDEKVVGETLVRRQKKIDAILLSGATERKWTKVTDKMLPPKARYLSSPLCNVLQKEMEKKVVPGGNFVELLRNHEVIKDLMVLVVDTIHYDCLHELYSKSPIRMNDECGYLLLTAFNLLDKAAVAGKLSHKCSFWWHVMDEMRSGRIHKHSPYPTCTPHVRSYLFQVLASELLSWCKDVLARVNENERPSGQASYLVRRNQQPAAAVTDFITVGKDVNTFVGFSLYSLKRKYGKYDELPEGQQLVEDKYWILVDMVAKEDDIAGEEEYLTLYYDQYMGVLNDGGLTLVAPRYANLFHGILYQIALSCNTQKMVENRNECMAIARSHVMNQVPGWAVKLEALTAGLLLSKPKEACTQILTEIITKTFNAKGNSIMKRYYSCFLARGGKKSSLSSNRESRKHEGLGGRKKTAPTPQPPPPHSK
jgi:hypothetical protein